MSKISAEDNLLKDLDKIVDLCVGNESPTDVSYDERSTLPECLAHLTSYPKSPSAVRDASEQIHKLSSLVAALNKKINMMAFKIELKLPKYK